MNKIRYKRKPKFAYCKLPSTTRASKEFVVNVQSNLEEFHIFKSQICGQKPSQLNCSSPRCSIKNTIQSAINKQNVLRQSFIKIAARRNTRLEGSLFVSAQRIYSIERVSWKHMELMKKSLKTEDSYPQFNQKKFTMKKVRRLFKSERPTKVEQLTHSLKAYCDNRMESTLFEPWQIRDHSQQFIA